MAGVFERLIKPQKSIMRRSSFQANSKAIELEVAKEILAEVFRIRLADVNEMIQNRFEVASYDGVNLSEDGLWPQEFWLSD